MATYSTNWWVNQRKDVNCTESEIIRSLQQTFFTDILPLSTSGEITISGIVSVFRVITISCTILLQ